MNRKVAQHSVDIATVKLIKAGNRCSGDALFHQETEEGYVCVLADGLGSGRSAQQSAEAVIEVIKENLTVEADQLLSRCNKVLEKRRGVVLGILRLDYKNNQYHFLSIGNIGLVVYDSERKRRRYIPQSGYLAGYKRAHKEEFAQLESGMNFLMFSDGVLEKELSQVFMREKNVNTVTHLYTDLYGRERADDTTLIALHYKNSYAK